MYGVPSGFDSFYLVFAGIHTGGGHIFIEPGRDVSGHEKSNRSDDPAELDRTDFILAGLGNLSGDVCDLPEDLPFFNFGQRRIDGAAEAFDGFIRAYPLTGADVYEIITR